MEIVGLKYEDVWKLLRKYQFVIEIAKHEEFICIICRGLLKNAHQNKCGCRYCYECIINFIHKDEKHCPGPTKECSQRFIDNNSDLQIDHTANRTVANIVVQCPITPCDVLIELKYMVNHVKLHKCQPQSYAFYDNRFVEETHYENYPSSHVNLLTDRIRFLNEKVEQLQKELDESQEKFLNVQSSIEEIRWKQNNAVENLKAINDKTAEELRQTQEKLMISAENDKKNQLIIRKLQQSLEEIKVKTDRKNREIDERLTQLEEYYLQSETNQEKLEQKLLALSSQPETVHASKIHKTKHDLVNCFELNSVESIVFENNQYAPFEWKITELSEKVTKAREGINTFIFSESFYSYPKGYKICLKLYPIGVNPASGRFLSLYFCIKKGDYDNILPWPMMHQISLQLIDQKTETVFSSDEYSYYSCNKAEKAVFLQPTTDINSGLGSSEFVKLNVVFNNKRLLSNNSIVIRCLVGI